MNESDIRKLLETVSAGKLSPEAALERLKHLPFEDIGFAKVDHHRGLRQGYAEVIFGKGKTPAQVAKIARTMLKHKASQHNVLVTRADAKMFAAVKRVSRGAKFHPSIRRDHDQAHPRDYREGHDPGCFRWHQRHSRGRGSSFDGAVDGQPRGAAF